MSSHVVCEKGREIVNRGYKRNDKERRVGVAKLDKKIRGVPQTPQFFHYATLRVLFVIPDDHIHVEPAETA